MKNNNNNTKNSLTKITFFLCSQIIRLILVSKPFFMLFMLKSGLGKKKGWTFN